MIIEAGYDLWDLMLPRLENEAAGAPALWMITMNNDLRLNSVQTISDRTKGVIVDHIADVIAGIAADFRPVGYFALAHRVDRLSNGIAEHIYHGDRAFLDSIMMDEKCFLGRLVFDGRAMYSSAPQYSFRDYPARSDLPRAGVTRGPHPFDCACFACTQFNEMIAAARARVDATRDVMVR